MTFRKLAAGLVFVAGLAGSSLASAAYLFESVSAANFAPPAINGLSVFDSQFIGSTFTLSEATHISGVGGSFIQFPSSPTAPQGGSIFAAVVGLGGNGLPGGGLNGLTDVLAYTVFTPSFAQALVATDILTPLALDLGPGTYGLVFGSDLFGATGRQSMPFMTGTVTGKHGGQLRIGAAPNTDPDAALWTKTSATTARIFVDGTAIAAVPEPESYALLLAGLGLIGVAARRRAHG